ncbi:unnamed protein product [Symbiodinium microadriaticum]|nr:unnamed protein product [Symbiodinium microadriaticum]
MLAERVAGMMDNLRDEMVSMLRDHEQRGCLVTELQDQLKTQTMKVHDLEKQVEELKELLASLHTPGTPDSQETRTPPSQRSPEHSESDSEAAEPRPSDIAKLLLQQVFLQVAKADKAEESKESEEVEPVKYQMKESTVASHDVAQWRCVWRQGMDVRSGPYVARKGIVGFLKTGQVFTVSEEKPGQEGTVFLKLADGNGWVFTKGRAGTFCVPAGDEWQSWRSGAQAVSQEDQAWAWKGQGKDDPRGSWSRSSWQEHEAPKTNWRSSWTSKSTPSSSWAKDAWGHGKQDEEEQDEYNKNWGNRSWTESRKWPSSY